MSLCFHYGKLASFGAMLPTTWALMIFFVSQHSTWSGPLDEKSKKFPQFVSDLLSMGHGGWGRISHKMYERHNLH